MKLQGEKNDLFKPKEFEEIKKQFELLSGQEINQLITNYENKGWINGYNDGEATMLFCLSKLDDETIIKEINEIRKAKDSSTLQSFATKLTIMANKSMER